jgi:hypothetical protein
MRPLRLISAASLIAIATALGGCDALNFNSTASNAEGVTADDVTRSADQVFAALARGEQAEALRYFASDVPEGDATRILQGLRDGPLRMVESVQWTKRSTRLTGFSSSAGQLEGTARLRNGDEVPIAMELRQIDRRWGVVEIRQTGQQRAARPARVLLSSTSETVPPQATSAPTTPSAPSPQATPEPAQVVLASTTQSTSQPVARQQPETSASRERLVEPTAQPTRVAQAPQPQPPSGAPPTVAPRQIPVEPAPAPGATSPPVAAPQAPPQVPLQPRIARPQVPAPVEPSPTVTPDPQPQPQAAPQQPRRGGAPLPPATQQADIPNEEMRLRLAKETMHQIVGSLAANDFAALHGNGSRFFQQTHTVADLQRTVRAAFQGVAINQETLTNRVPRLIGQPFIGQDGMWRQQGVYDLGGNRRIAFRFAFTAEDGVWKLGRFIVQQQSR